MIKLLRRLLSLLGYAASFFCFAVSVYDLYFAIIDWARYAIGTLDIAHAFVLFVGQNLLTILGLYISSRLWPKFED